MLHSVGSIAVLSHQAHAIRSWGYVKGVTHGADLQDPYAFDSPDDSWIFREGLRYSDLIHSTVLW
ncbi:hypothetical protein C3V38_16080 (plasmid) [Dietzia sp. oral taxon 368]|nr:hypothetical protein C3V38_16080 [Dietzia sp. oral taxon 368]